MSMSPAPVPNDPGKLTLTIAMANDGNVRLTSPSVNLTPGNITFVKASPQFAGGDADLDGSLDAGETWSWNVSITSPATYAAVGRGVDTHGNTITFPGDPQARAELPIQQITVGSAQGAVWDRVPVSIAIATAVTGVKGFDMVFKVNTPRGVVAADTDVILPDYSTTFVDPSDGSTVSFELTQVAASPNGASFPASEVRISVADLSDHLTSVSGAQTMVTAVCVTLQQLGSSTLSLNLNLLDDDQSDPADLTLSTLIKFGTLTVGNTPAPNTC